MAEICLVRHAPGAPGFRLFGLGPKLLPKRGLLKLQRLFDKHAFWAQNRSIGELRQMLASSQIIVTLWRGKRLIGFGRAHTDGVYRGVLWDIVVAGDLQGRGLGKQVIEALLSNPKIIKTEKIYIIKILE